MIRKFGILVFACTCFILSAMAQSVMTDEQVRVYVENAVEAGKTQQTIAQELMLKGVSRQQMLKVYQKFQAEKGLKKDVKKTEKGRRRLKNPNDAKNDSLMLDSLDFEKEEIPDSLQVYGRNIFRNKNLNFAPNENLATPRNYRLGPGDEVIIDVFGANQVTIREEISSEGSINVDVLGPVYLNGMTVEEANIYLKRKLAQIYAGIGNGGATNIRLSLGQIRSIQVNVLGDVEYPGTYTISSFATAFHALYLAGGIKEPGSLRNIKVTRGGRQMGTVDVYDYLMNGSRDGDVRLEDGDVILVPAYSSLVKVKGLVKRPMFFEMKKGENLAQLLNYAGGFERGAYTDALTVTRQNGKEYEICTVENGHYETFRMQNGDEVEVGKLLSRFENRLTIKGAVFREGNYQLSGKINTVRSLIEAAGGTLPEAFTTRAVMHREKADRSLEVLSVDVAGILSGKAPDVVLKNNDVLFIPSVYDLKDQGILTIQGEVAAPGIFPYAGNTTLEDLIIQAGGLLESASLARVDVARRVKDVNATTAQKDIAEMFSFSMKEGFVISGQPGFVLEPYDEVYVRKSPSYAEQQNVSVTGEVNFTGTYPLTLREERLSSLLQKTGGTTEFAYIKGARLVRKISDEERKMMDKVVESMMNDATDSLTAQRLKNYGDEYYVGIDLEKALARPGSSDDVILRAGDRLEIPVYNNTVRVLGAVTSANVVAYKEKKNYKYYINEAGGFTDMARKGHAYVVYMNGHISQLKRSTDILPGSEIVVPKRSRPRATFSEVLSSISGVASLATTIMSLAVIMKK